MRCRHGLIAIVLVFSAFTPKALACDMDHVFCDPSGPVSEEDGRFQVALSVQSSDLGSLQLEGSTIPNSNGEDLQSTITQTVLSYQVAPQWSVQLNVPYLDRSFDRMTAEGLESGSERGVGDAVLMARYAGKGTDWGRARVSWSAVLGLELPTGDTDRLGEHEPAAHAIEEPHHEEDHEAASIDASGHDHHASNVHGHDLALGNGAVDIVAATGIGIRTDRLALQGLLQHTIRSEGDFDYRFADQTHLTMSSLFSVRQTDRSRLAVGLGLLGEEKGSDTMAGETMAGTSMRSLYMGPVVNYAAGSKVRASLSVDLPVAQDNSDIQLVVDRRVRFSAMARF